MDLQSRIAEILNNQRLADDVADEEQLIAEYGAANKPEAIYLLADKYGWQQLYGQLVQILRNDAQSQHWETAQIVLFYAASDHNHKTRRCPMPADSTIALLYNRFPNGIDDGDRIWAVVCALKGVEHWSDYDPMHDADILRELDTLKRA